MNNRSGLGTRALWISLNLFLIFDIFAVYLAESDKPLVVFGSALFAFAFANLLLIFFTRHRTRRSHVLVAHPRIYGCVFLVWGAIFFLQALSCVLLMSREMFVPYFLGSLAGVAAGVVSLFEALQKFRIPLSDEKTGEHDI